MFFGPSTKFAFTFLLGACAFALSWQLNIALAVFVVFLEHRAKPFRPRSSQTHRAFRRFAVQISLLALFIVILNSLFLRGAGQKIGSLDLPLYVDGLKFGLAVGTRVMLLSLSILLFFTSTSLREFSFLLLNAGIPTSIVTIILLSSHFVEQLPSKIGQIFSAQEARGAPVKSKLLARARSLFSVLSPLVLSSIAESVERGTALELRGFRGQLQIRKSDGEKLSFPGYVFLLLGVLAILWKVLWK